MPFSRSVLSVLAVLSAGLAHTALAAEAPGRAYARSVLASRDGIVATSQVVASQIGADILARGGSAVDAAVAANLALGVLEPQMGGPGGDLFALYRDAATGELIGLNASGGAPAGQSAARLRALGLQQVPDSGIETVTVPGAVAGWAALHRRFGKLPWRELVRPAARLARDGFAVSERMAEFWQAYLPESCIDPECRQALMPGGRAPAFGETFRNPDLAYTLDVLAREGSKAFYRGSIAKAIIGTSTLLGGTMTLEDLAGYSPEWVTPLSSSYRGWTVYELPPNSRGAIVLEALKILEQFPAPADGPVGVDAMHLRVESLRIANASAIHLVDPRAGGRPVEWLFEEARARKEAATINASRAGCERLEAREPPRSDTTFIAAVDAQGNMISLIQSLATGDSGVVIDGHGFLMQNRGIYFSLEPGHPNELAPGKRTSHTLTPAHMERDGVHIAFGVVGGPSQPAGQVQFISDIVDYGYNIQAALETPQFVLRPRCTLNVEQRVPMAVVDQLWQRGHEVKLTPPYDDLMTVGQAVQWDERTDTKLGASSPRGDGAALPATPRPR